VERGDADEEELQEADRLAREALRIGRTRQTPAWLAVYHVARALGQEARAEHARQNALAAHERWLDRADVEKRLDGAEGQETTPAAQNAPGANGP
jgi:hypothetical protein